MLDHLHVIEPGSDILGYHDSRSHDSSTDGLPLTRPSVDRLTSDSLVPIGDMKNPMFFTRSGGLF
jgi:hypothetical protein